MVSLEVEGDKPWIACLSSPPTLLLSRWFSYLIFFYQKWTELCIKVKVQLIAISSHKVFFHLELITKNTCLLDSKSFILACCSFYVLPEHRVSPLDWLEDFEAFYDQPKQILKAHPFQAQLSKKL